MDPSWTESFEFPTVFAVYHVRFLPLHQTSSSVILYPYPHRFSFSTFSSSPWFWQPTKAIAQAFFFPYPRTHILAKIRRSAAVKHQRYCVSATTCFFHQQHLYLAPSRPRLNHRSLTSHYGRFCDGDRSGLGHRPIVRRWVACACNPVFFRGLLARWKRGYANATSAVLAGGFGSGFEGGFRASWWGHQRAMRQCCDVLARVGANSSPRMEYVSVEQLQRIPLPNHALVFEQEY